MSDAFNTAVTERWRNIRRDPKCDLSLTPESVAEYLRTPESKLVADRIRETLVQLARFRVRKKGYRSKEPDAPGQLATCEGLETFLVPAVEGALSFSSVLDELVTTDCTKTMFADTVVDDVEELLEHWRGGRFSGEPYAREDTILAALQPIHAVKLRKLDIVEAAAMACRVITHLLTLKLMRDEEIEFRALIGDRIDEATLFEALKNAIGFLVGSFRKGTWDSEEGKLSGVDAAGTGSGWSWTDWPGLPPMLFFTAAAVDAFAELDLYLIRVVDDETTPNHPGRRKLLDFYKRNSDFFEQFQVCVEMTRRWVQARVLPALSLGEGFHSEPEIKTESKRLSKFNTEMERDGLASPPLLYNSLYGLQILLWCWADRDETGLKEDGRAKSAINRALAQLVYNYDRVPLVKKILAEVDYVVSLPGKAYFKEGTEEERHYLDSGFLPLLTRLLVLFVVYGVGDRNLLEPVIRNLYVELLQNRHRNDPDLTALWSAKSIQIFSTQRAVQALTFYYAYAAGREKVDGRMLGELDVDSAAPNRIVLRSSIGLPLILEARLDGTLPVTSSPEPLIQDPVLPNPMVVGSFSAYCKQIKGHRVTPSSQQDVGELQTAVLDEGDRLLEATKTGKVRDPILANFVLYTFARLLETPWKDGVARLDDFKTFKEMSTALVSTG